MLSRAKRSHELPAPHNGLYQAAQSAERAKRKQSWISGLAERWLGDLDSNQD